MHYVLVVCDDEEDTAFLDQAFHTQPTKIHVNCMESGVQLMEYMKECNPAEFPFLIVIDQYLRDIDSLALLGNLKSDKRSMTVPVAIMSGFASETLIRDYYRAGANCFYKKPLDNPEWSHMADCLLTLFYNAY